MTDADLIEIIADGIVDGTDMDCTTVDQARAVLKALRDAGVLPQWRPIETAPKDGTHVLAFWPSIYDAENATQSESWFGPRWSDLNAECVWQTAYEYGDELTPTHWMPLPETPQ
jgi:hypothetical protein